MHEILYEGQVVASSQANVTASVGENAVASEDSQQIIVESPNLWSPDAPHLYELVTEPAIDLG